MKIVMVGDPVDGVTLYGPFIDGDAATEWAEGHQRNQTWWVVEIEAPVYSGRGTHLETVLGRGDVAHLITEAADLLDSPGDVNPDAPVAEYVRGMSELIRRYAGFTDDEDYTVAIRDAIRRQI